MKIGIVNLSIGNVGSVFSAFAFYGYDVSLVKSPESLRNSDILVLAGVGNFSTAVGRLQDLNIWEALDEEVRVKGKPVLGICLGMQLFADFGVEDGRNGGFGWLRGEVEKLKGKDVKVPHIGWNELRIMNDTLFSGMRYNFFYFMHSFHYVPAEENVVQAYTRCGDIDIVAAVRKDNIVGVQFHPEKSQGDGLRFLKNFVEVMS